LPKSKMDFWSGGFWGWRNTALARDGDRGARQEGPYVPVTVWKTAPPFTMKNEKRKVKNVNPCNSCNSWMI
jgi:hypothetical protein